MREPAFWWRRGSGGLLAPFAALYGAVAWGRIQAQGQSAGVPVICLGNLTVGGAGKTPAALAVAHLLLAVRERPFFLSRGYGGKLAGPVRVDPSFHRAADVGDEPLMLARLAPTIVARDRVAGARVARAAGASVIVMDDGFQNPSLTKDLAVIPAGPLRAPLEIQIARAQAIVVVGPPDGAAKILDTARRYRVTVFHGRLEADRNSLAALGKRKVLAFAGIGNPEKFFATLTEAGIAVAARSSFPDHHRYTAAEAQGLIARAQAENLVLITTEKDHVRLADDPALAALKAHASALPVRLFIDEQDAFRQMVLNAAKRA
jgi:tetraacyldisaccharide 4'-kinase